MEFDEKKRKMEEDADSKTAKNRAKRLKKKERSKTKGNGSEGQKEGAGAPTAKPSNDAPLKKRRLVNGSELVFRKPGEEDEEDGDGDEGRPSADDRTAFG